LRPIGVRGVPHSELRSHHKRVRHLVMRGSRGIVATAIRRRRARNFRQRGAMRPTRVREHAREIARAAIARHMAADINELVASAGAAASSDLQSLDWIAAQIAIHGEPASVRAQREAVR
jgi:hypothetical protein